MAAALRSPGLIYLPSPRAGILVSLAFSLHGLSIHLIERTFFLCFLPGGHLAGRPGCPCPDRRIHNSDMQKAGATTHLPHDPCAHRHIAVTRQSDNPLARFSSLEFLSGIFENRTGCRQKNVWSFMLVLPNAARMEPVGSKRQSSKSFWTLWLGWSLWAPEQLCLHGTWKITRSF